MAKRYYWIKLRESFLTSDAVDFLMSQKNGAQYVVLYQMLCLKTANTDGQLARKIGDVLLKYDVDKIQRDTKYFDVDTIRVALELYKNLGLVYEGNDKILQIANFDKMVGAETKWAKYKRVERNKEETKKLDNVQKMSNKILDIDIDIDKDIRYKDKDKDKDKDKESDKLIKDKLIKDKLINQTSFGKTFFTKQLLIEGKIKGELEAKLSDQIFEEFLKEYEEKDLIVTFYYTFKRIPKDTDNILGYLRSAIKRNLENKKKEKELYEKL